MSAWACKCVSKWVCEYVGISAYEWNKKRVSYLFTDTRPFGVYRTEFQSSDRIIAPIANATPRAVNITVISMT